jgi:hypothetical protein
MRSAEWYANTLTSVQKNALHLSVRKREGTKFGPRKNSRRFEAGKRPARSSHRRAGRNNLTSDCEEDERRRSPSIGTNRRRARQRSHSGGPQAIIVGDEEALGRTQKEIVLRRAWSESPWIELPGPTLFDQTRSSAQVNTKTATSPTPVA